MMNRKTLLWLVLLVVLPTLVFAESSKEKKQKLPKVPWQNYHPAMATGKAESKHILLHFATDWARESKAMKVDTYGDFKVARYLEQNFATAWIDSENFPTLAKKYKVNNLPTLWFLDPKGKRLTRVDGYLGPEKMLMVLEFINTKAYEKMSYESWKGKRPRR